MKQGAWLPRPWWTQWTTTMAVKSRESSSQTRSNHQRMTKRIMNPAGFCIYFALFSIIGFQVEAAKFYPLGCYKDTSDFTRLIPFIRKDLTRMTPELCASLAQAAGCTIFSVQYGQDCHGGYDLQVAISLGPSTTCNMACTGNRSQTCGGLYSNFIYTFTSLPPSPSPPPPRPPNPLPSPPSNLPLAKFYPLGCYKDTSDFTRLIPFIRKDLTRMTPEFCASLAQAAGWTIFSVQYGEDCHGGFNLSLAMSLGPSTVCNMACTGNRSQTCGGLYSNFIYTFITLPPSPSPPTPRPPNPPNPPNPLPSPPSNFTL
ncbi:hypothetical protein Vafri_16992, partial [Volvox africanus]